MSLSTENKNRLNCQTFIAEASADFVGNSGTERLLSDVLIWSLGLRFPFGFFGHGCSFEQGRIFWTMGKSQGGSLAWAFNRTNTGASQAWFVSCNKEAEHIAQHPWCSLWNRRSRVWSVLQSATLYTSFKCKKLVYRSFNEEKLKRQDRRNRDLSACFKHWSRKWVSWHATNKISI